MNPPDVTTDAKPDRARDDVRARIIARAVDLLTRKGRDALTTRAVAEAAGVQAPTLYRLVGDKDRLLDAVAEHGFAAYLEEKKFRPPGKDPVADLRAGWDLHVGFGLANPAIYLLMYADPQPGARRPAAEAAHRLLCEHMRRVAAAGRLRVSEARAVHLFHASACGIVLTLLAMDEAQRDLRLSELARETALAAITTASPVLESPGPAAAAIALRATLSEATPFSEGERRLLAEWLDRLAAGMP